MHKLLLLDLDGTLREPLRGTQFTQHPRDQQIIAGADRAISHYHERGWLAIGISNQGGVAAGHKSLDSAISEQQYTLELFPELRAIYFCPDFEGKQCIKVGRQSTEPFLAYTRDDTSAWHNDPDLWKNRLPGVLIGPMQDGFSFRKPGSGMIEKAILDYMGRDLNSFLELMDRRLADCWFVGDRPEDEQAAEAAGVNFLHAEVWRDRFRPGIHEHPINLHQLRFLEGISAS